MLSWKLILAAYTLSWVVLFTTVHISLCLILLHEIIYTAHICAHYLYIHVHISIDASPSFSAQHMHKSAQPLYIWNTNLFKQTTLEIQLIFHLFSSTWKETNSNTLMLHPSTNTLTNQNPISLGSQDMEMQAMAFHSTKALDTRYKNQSPTIGGTMLTKSTLTISQSPLPSLSSSTLRILRNC